MSTLPTTTISAEIREEKIEECRTLVAAMSAKNVVTARELRKALGLSNHVASLVFIVRPFLSEMWAALAAESGGRIWVKQFTGSLTWLAAFFALEPCRLSRSFVLRDHLSRGPRTRIITDASPWGLGGVVSVEHRILGWFTSELDHRDSRRYGVPLGDAAEQQIWEALALLVALRLWRKIWTGRRPLLEVKSDNVSALTLFATLRATSSGLNLVAREFALDISLQR